MPTRRAGPATLIVLGLAGLAAAQGAPPAPPSRAAGAPPLAAGAGSAVPPPAGAPTPALSLHAAWSTDLPALPAGPPAFDAGRLFVPLRDGRLAAVLLERGALAWTIDAAPAAIDAGGGLVFLAAGDTVEARDAASGDPAWRYQADGPLAPSLAWEGGWLLAATASGDALMLRARDGTLLWRQRLGARPSRAAMTADRIYLALDDGRVIARRLADGGPIWEQSLGGRPTALRALDDRLFVGADDKFLYCLDAGDGGRRWRWRTGGGVTGTPDVDEDRVYFVAFDNVLRALNRGNGHQRWMSPLGFRPTGGPLLVNGLLLVPALSTDLALFRADTGARAGSVPAGAEPIALPRMLPAAATAAAPSDVTLVVVGRGGTVARFGASPPPLAAKPIPGAPKYLQEREMQKEEGNYLLPFTF